MKAAVVCFPGSNCEMDTVRALHTINGEQPALVWHKDGLPSGLDLVVLPGGFSYGDYLRAGAIARFSPVMRDVVAFANSGGLVLGICNGFQILCEAHLLPGALVKNRSLRFVCRSVHLRVERAGTAFTRFDERVLHIPVAHGMGNYFAAPEDVARLTGDGCVVFRYCGPDGKPAADANPNGSVEDIAGICNLAGNVLGMMPHPERAMSAELGSTDGRLIFDSVKRFVEAGGALAGR